MNDNFKDIILGASFMISVFLFFIHIRNSRIQSSAYNLNRSTHWSSANDLVFISSEQLDDNVLLKLVFFNPGSVAAVLQSFCMYETPTSYRWLRVIFKSLKWRRIENAYWWPTSDPGQKELRFVAEEYENLYVEDKRVIMVLMPGMIDRRRYLFRLDTNHGYVTTEIDICATATYFAYRNRRSFRY